MGFYILDHDALVSFACRFQEGLQIPNKFSLSDGTVWSPLTNESAAKLGYRVHQLLDIQWETAQASVSNTTIKYLFPYNRAKHRGFPQVHLWSVLATR